MTVTQPSDLRAGDVLVIDRAASVQFTAPFLFRLIKVHDRETFDGWCWIDGRVLDGRGRATARRTLYVHVGALTVADRGPEPRVPRPAPPNRGRFGYQGVIKREKPGNLRSGASARRPGPRTCTGFEEAP
jgi:hypothetical protein